MAINNNEAVSSVVGAMLMFSIVVTLFGVVYAGILENPIIPISNSVVYIDKFPNKVLIHMDRGNYIDKYTVTINGEVVKEGVGLGVGDSITVDILDNESNFICFFDYYHGVSKRQIAWAYYERVNQTPPDPYESAHVFLSVYDGWVDINGYLVNDSDNLKITADAGDGQQFAFIEWNISAIPDNATILGVGFEFMSYDEEAEGDSTVNGLSIRPSISTPSEVWNRIRYGPIDGFTRCGMPGDVPINEVRIINETIGTGTWIWNQMSPTQNVQNSLDDDWFAICIKRVSNEAEFRSIDYGHPYPRLWVDWI